MEIVHLLTEDLIHTETHLQNIIAINRNHDWDEEEDYDFQQLDLLHA